MTFLKKQFLNFFDLNKKKSTSIYKIFKVPQNIEKSCVSKDKNFTIVTAKN